MSLADPTWGDLLWGPLAVTAGDAVALTARLCDLRPRFLPKGRVGRGHRAVARNGRILLASDAPVTELGGQAASVRLQTWHRAILPGDVPELFGLLLCIRKCPSGGTASHDAELNRRGEERAARADLVLDVGGGMVLAFYASTTHSIAP